jgi:hypothetical protein
LILDFVIAVHPEINVNSNSCNSLSIGTVQEKNRIDINVINKYFILQCQFVTDYKVTNL